MATAVDDLFHDSPQPTATETEKAFQLDFMATLGNVRASFSESAAQLRSQRCLPPANTMAMSIREQTREVAVLKALGFTQRSIWASFVGEGVPLALLGGLLGALACVALAWVVAESPQVTSLFTGLAVTVPSVGMAWGSPRRSAC